MCLIIFLSFIKQNVKKNVFYDLHSAFKEFI